MALLPQRIERLYTMNRLAICACAAALLTGAAIAKTPNASGPDTKEEKSSAQVVCKDGTKLTVDTTRGACHGHGGIDKSASADVSTHTSGAAGTTSSTARATAGGPGKVWVNDSTKVYHCQGDRWYGKTKHGEYMSESQAKDKGYHADHGKSCG
jgi:hypothetical protein